MNRSDPDIAFLANSDNRVAILESLRDGPHSRHVLEEQTGVSRVTLGRILDDLEDRRWITQEGQVCDITVLGDWVVEEYLAFSELMDAERRLREVVRWFPEADYGFHIGRLADADITVVSRADASAPLSRHVRLFEDGGRYRSFSFAITRLFLESCHQHVTDGTITFEWVFTPEVLDVLRGDPRLASHSAEMLETGRVEYRRSDEDIPYIVLLSEESVNLRLADDDGSPTALIQSDDEAVRTWAEATFEDYWEDATPVTVDEFEYTS